jgi:hypothetical protein
MKKLIFTIALFTLCACSNRHFGGKAGNGGKGANGKNGENGKDGKSGINLSIRK